MSKLISLDKVLELIEEMKRLSIKTLSSEGVIDSSGYYHALTDLSNRLKNLN